MRLFSVLLCAGFIIIAAQTARADDASLLLAKHKAYVGWQFGDGAFTSLSVDSERVKTSNNVVDRKYHTVHIGAVYRETFESAQGQHDDGFTGNIFWSSNINGFPRPVRGDVVKYIISEQILFNEGTTLLPAEARGSASVNGKTVSVVRVKPEQGDVIDLSIDPSSGAYVAATIDPGGTYERTMISSTTLMLCPAKRSPRNGNTTIANTSAAIQRSSQMRK